MLELLAKLATGAEPGFAEKQIRWALSFDGNGRFLDVLELGDAGTKGNRGQTFSRCPEFIRQYKQAGGKSEFLWDTAEIVARYAENPDDEDLGKKHDHFVQLLRGAAAVMPELTPIANALNDDDVLTQIRKRLEEKRVRPNDKVTLLIDDEYPLASPAWHDWWREQYRRLCTGRQADKAEKRSKRAKRKMVCLVSGEIVEPLETHPKIEGLAGVGGQPSGDVLVGMDKDAFTSYFLQQSANAAVAQEAAYRYRAALNELIRNNSRKLAGALVVHWFKSTVRKEDDPLDWLDNPPGAEESMARKAASDLLDSIASGKRADLGDNRYYALVLSGAAGRVMVRDWMEGQFEELARNIGNWFEDLSVVHRDAGRLAPDPTFQTILRSTVFGRNPKEKDDNLPPPFVAKMWRVAVRGEPIPQAALAMALARFKADILDKDKTFDHARMGLMKAYFVRKARKEGKENHMRQEYNWQHPSPAYHCGGTMAVLAKLQQAALGDVGAGVVQRYYAAASATPALVLGRIIRTAQYHLNKLEPGLAHWYEEKLGQLALAIGDNYPQTLTVEGQSLFALGYYQMWVELRTKKSEENK
ncbi:MAG: type I-C CRISPR-associated protein Cas8c/Csd1 [candidate division WOR-3 bacterium]